LNENRVHIYEATLSSEKIEGEIVERIDGVGRAVVARGNNTSDMVSATLYKYEDGKLVEVDHESSSSFPSYLKGYFYHKHGFKMLEKSERDVDYENTYDPAEHENVDYACPNCHETNVEIWRWQARCQDCGYSGSEPRFNTDREDHRVWKDIGYRRDIRSDTDIEWQQTTEGGTE